MLLKDLGVHLKAAVWLATQIAGPLCFDKVGARHGVSNIANRTPKGFRKGSTIRHVGASVTAAREPLGLDHAINAMPGSFHQASMIHI